MSHVWLTSSIWLCLALLASIISIRVAISVALIEIVVGAVAGNTIGLTLTEWVNFLAGFGAILLTFLAGPRSAARSFGGISGRARASASSASLLPISGSTSMGATASAGAGPRLRSPASHFRRPRSRSSMRSRWRQVSTRPSSAIILAACFVNDLGTVLALGVVFARYDLRLAGFGALTALALWLLPRFSPWFFGKVGHRSASQRPNLSHSSSSASAVSPRSPATKRCCRPTSSAWRSRRPFSLTRDCRSACGSSPSLS